MSPWRSKAWARLQPGLVSPAGPPAANCLRDFIFWRSQRCPCQLARRRALTWKSWTWEEKSQRCLSPEQSLRSPWSDFLHVCADAFQTAANRKIAVISGSLPPGVPIEACAALVSSARSANCLAFVDSSGAALSKALAAGPDLVKVNREEAEFVTQVAIRDPISAAQAARKLLDLGANSSAISLGERGLVGVRKHDSTAIHAWTDPLRPKSTVGCGDSALAGMAFAAATELPFEQSLALAVACGTSNCLAELPGRMVREDVSRIERGVHIERL